MKLILILALSFLLHPQLFAQNSAENPVPFKELKETEQEIRNGNINIYHYKGELFTGIAIEKKLTHYFLYHFKNGKKHGNSTHYSKTDKAKREWEYQNGMLRATREWYSNGDLKSEVQFSRKCKAEKKTTYYRNGQIEEKIKFGRSSSNQKVKRYSKKGDLSEKGKETYIESGKKMVTIKVGKWIYYDRHGKRKKVEVYDQQGEIISSKKF